MKLDFFKQNKTYNRIKKQDPILFLAKIHNTNNKSKYFWKSRPLTIINVFINAQSVYAYIKIYDHISTSNQQLSLFSCSINPTITKWKAYIIYIIIYV